MTDLTTALAFLILLALGLILIVATPVVYILTNKTRLANWLFIVGLTLAFAALMFGLTVSVLSGVVA